MLMCKNQIIYGVIKMSYISNYKKNTIILSLVFLIFFSLVLKAEETDVSVYADGFDNEDIKYFTIDFTQDIEWECTVSRYAYSGHATFKIYDPNDNLVVEEYSTASTSSSRSGLIKNAITGRWKVRAGAPDRGLLSAKGSVTYQDDKSGPSINHFYINNGQNFMSDNKNLPITLHISAEDVMGVKEMCFSNSESSGFSNWESYKTSKSWIVSSGDGTKKIYIKLKDSLGNISTYQTSNYVQIDTTGPTKNKFTINNGAIATNNISTTLNISASDNISGIAEMRLKNEVDKNYLSWQSYRTNKNWQLSIGDGDKLVYVQFRDSLGNTSSIYSDNILLDTTPPVINNVLIEKIGESIRMTWDAYDELSQISNYVITCLESNSIPDSKAGEIIYEKYKVFSNLSVDKTYYIWVKAVDELGNESEWLKSDLISFKPPATKITSINPNSKYEDHEVLYSIELQLEKVNMEIPYVIERKNPGTNSWVELEQVSYNSLLDNNFIYKDNNELVSHSSYRYKVYTLNGNEKSEDFISNTVIIPNINADLNLPSTDNNPISKELVIENIPDTDIEGDIIRFLGWYQLGENGIAQRITEDFQSGSITYKFPSDGEWLWWLEVEESNENFDFNITYETDKRTIIVDTTQPNGNLAITNTSGVEYTEEIPTNTEEVRLEITDLTDSNGVIDSGIEKLTIYNGTTKPAKIYNMVDAIDVEGNLDTDISFEISDGIAGMEVSRDNQYNLPWILESGNDGQRTVSIEITDNAGNKRVISENCKLDTTSPPLSSYFTHNHSTKNNNPTIIFTWQNTADDVSDFIVKYNNEEKDAELSLEGEISIGSYEISVNDLGYNQAVAIEVIAVDKAGNRSEPANYTAYTKAQVGEIGNISGGYSDEYEHYLEFSLIEPNSGNVSSHVLEFGIFENGEFSKAMNGNIELSVNATFIHSLLEAHQVNDYRLVAYNESGDPTYAAVEENIEVPNTPPTKPIIDNNSYPQNWTVNINESNQVEFNYIPANDVDKDTIDHIVYWAEGNYSNNEPEIWNIYNEGKPDNTPLIIDSVDTTEHGKTYTWYVKAKEDTEDYHEESISDKVTFTVDLNRPTIEIEELDLYTNKESITVTANDIKESSNPNEVFSDIDYISYILVYADGTLTEKRIITELTPDGNNGWIAQLPLIEGEYTLQLSAFDKASNESNILNKEIKVDYTIPQINSYSLDTLMESGIYKTYRNRVDLYIDMEDSLSNDFASGVSKLKYWFVTNQGDEESLQAKTKNIDDGIDSYQLELDMSDLIDGQQYYLAIQAEDNVGNSTEITYLDNPILIDRTPPSLSLEVSELKAYGANQYLSSLEELSIESSAVDEESDIDDSGYRVYSINNDEYINSEWLDLKSIKNTLLTDGAEYCLVFRASNRVGNSTTIKSENFIYDSSAPTNVYLTVPDGKFISGEVITFTTEAVDSHSPIKSYKLAIGSTPGGRELTSLIAGNIDGYMEMEFINSKYRLRLPEVSDGTYYTTLLVRNAADKTSSYQGNNIEVDNKQEKLIVNDEGPYTASDTQLSAEWQYSGEKEIKEYSFRIKIRDGEYITEDVTVDENQVTVSGLNLEQGQTYQFEITAVFIEEIPALQENSAGVTVDTTYPVINTFNSPEYSTSDKIKFDWDGNDEESGKLKVEVALGTGYNQTDATDGWVELINNTLNYDSNGKALDLNTGQHYYPMLRITNGAERQADLSGTSIIIDDTPPPAPIVDDHAHYINLEQTIILDWTMTELQNRLDSESGNSKYYWAYSKEISDLTLDNQSLTWNEVDSTLKVRFDNITQIVDDEITNGTTYYFAVKTQNGAGLENIGSADGLIVDRDAPSIPELRVLSTINLDGEEIEKEVNYLNSIEDVKLWIESNDPQSRVNKYEYVYGLKDELKDIDRIQWTEYPIEDENEYNKAQVIDINNPNFEEGEIYKFAGESYNGAELISQTGYSSGVILDITAPKIINVNGIASGDNLIFDWDVDLDSSRSPIVWYETALVTNPTKTPEQWDNNGLSKILTIDASTFNDGRYYLKVRAINAAGNHSRSGDQFEEVGLSPVVILDRTPPEVTELVHPDYVHNEFETIIKAQDNEFGSGISTYQYALGTYVNPTLYSGNWHEVINLADHAEIEDLIKTILDTGSLKSGKEIYLRARVKDNVDMWSEIKKSKKIIVDHTPPIVDEISISGPETVNTTDKIKALNLIYDGAEIESKITHYRISVSEEKDDQNWETDPLNQAIAEFDNMISDLELEEKAYYLVVELFNSVGLSTIKYSEEPVIIDITPPILTFSDITDELVFNNPSVEKPGQLKYMLSETANVSFVLTKPGGEAVEYPTEEGLLAEQEYIFDFIDNAYGVYNLKPIVVDKAGNIMVNEVSKQIRVNQPPIITFSEDEDGIAFYTTKGKELILEPLTAYDPDSGSDLDYIWDTGEDPSTILYDSCPEHIYTELDEYIITLIATDVDDGVTTVVTKVKVDNTTRGQLYMDETWSKNHRIYDDVLVPIGIKLTVLPETAVIVDGIPGETGYNHLLDIEGELEIAGEIGKEVMISSVKNQIDSWQGIRIIGHANITGLDIRDAFRAITVIESGQALIQDSIFRNNKVGLHVYGSNPEVVGSQFIDNLLYGIKEDNGGQPFVIDSIFSGNGIDYYHQELNKITIDYLNSIDGNSGNIGQ